MMMNWRGEDCDNFYKNRKGYKPFLIADHISIGTRESVFNTFTNPNNDNASSHFVVCRDGIIDQYVRIQDGAWTQGRSFPIPSELRSRIAPAILKMGAVNPNLYCVSIEHEGYEDNGADGTLTEAQFYASCWLHRYIKDEIRRLYNVTISLNPYYVIGHFQIDPIRKPYCPGPNFPWSRLYTELAVADKMSLADYEGRILFLQSGKYKKGVCYQVFNEVDWLASVAKQGDGVGEWARGVLLGLFVTFASQEVLPDKYTAGWDFAQFRNDVRYIYDCSIGEHGPDLVNWGIECLMQVYPSMLQSGLVNAVA